MLLEIVAAALGFFAISSIYRRSGLMVKEISANLKLMSSIINIMIALTGISFGLDLDEFQCFVAGYSLFNLVFLHCYSELYIAMDLSLLTYEILIFMGVLFNQMVGRWALFFLLTDVIHPIIFVLWKLSAGPTAFHAGVCIGRYIFVILNLNLLLVWTIYNRQIYASILLFVSLIEHTWYRGSINRHHASAFPLNVQCYL